MKKILLVVMVATLLGSFTLKADEGHQHLQTVKMKIEGMTCSVCSAKIKKSLSSLCKESSIDHKKGEGSCSYEEGKATPEQVMKAVNDTGFKASLAK